MRQEREHWIRAYIRTQAGKEHENMKEQRESMAGLGLEHEHKQGLVYGLDRSYGT